MLIKEVELKKWGNSQGIRIAKDDLEELGASLDETKFTMVIDNGQIVLKPIKKFPETLAELFAGYDGEPLSKEDIVDWWDEPVGKEII